MPEPIKPEHKPYIDTIRRLWEESGGKLLYPVETFGLNRYGRKASEPGAIELLFDYGSPVEMCVDEGGYTFGSKVGADPEEFWRLLGEAYTVHIVRPQRDDSKLRVNSFEYQCGCSGPLVALVEKG